jgi:Bacterial Ig-like domain/Kelch motif
MHVVRHRLARLPAATAPAILRRGLPALLLLVLPLLLLAPLAACGGAGGASGSEPPRFAIVSSHPSDGAQAVQLDAVVRVTFTEQVDPSTVFPGAIRVGVIGGAGEIAGTTAVAKGDAWSLTWTATGMLAPLSSHTVLVSSSLRAVSGDVIGGDLDFTFRTADETPEVPIPPGSSLRLAVGNLQVGRRSHTATLLADGTVLLAGGFVQGTEVTDTAEIYDPLSETFRLLPSRMAHARAGHTATRLGDGRVLLCGGWYEVTLGQLATTATAELYDPDTETFLAVGDMTKARVDHAASLLTDGRVLVTGGSRLDGDFLVDFADAEMYLPATKTFQAHPASMTHTRATHGAVWLTPTRLLLAGGSDTDARCDFFDLGTETFSPLGAAAQDGARFGPAVAAFSDGFGCVAGGDTLGTVLSIDPATGLVQNTGSGLTVSRSYATATRISSNVILVAGGLDSSQLGIFLLSTCDIVVRGGPSGSRTYSTSMRFDTGMVFHTATRLVSGRILFCGGLNSIGGAHELAAAYLYLP